MLESSAAQPPKASPVRTVNRQELEAMAAGAGTSSGPVEHDDE
jgi:hypothetical protein